MRIIVASVLSLLLCEAANAQGYVYQSGSITPGHAVQWLTSGVIGDAGTAASGKLTSLGVTNNGGPGICVNSGPPTGPYNAFCLSVSTSGAATMSLQNYGGASPQTFDIVINGTAYPFPGALTSITVGSTPLLNGNSGYILFQNGASPTGTVGEIATTGSAGPVVLAVSPTLSGVIGGALTFSGPITFSGGISASSITSPLATNAVMGVMEGDGSSITCSSGVCTAIGASAALIDAGGATSITNGKPNDYLYDNAGNVGHSGLPYVALSSLVGAI